MPVFIIVIDSDLPDAEDAVRRATEALGEHLYDQAAGNSGTAHLEARADGGRIIRRIAITEPEAAPVGGRRPAGEGAEIGRAYCQVIRRNVVWETTSVGDVCPGCGLVVLADDVPLPV